MKPKTTFGAVANVFTRMMHFQKAGDVEDVKQTLVDHLALLATGSVKVTIDDVETVFKAPHMIYIRAGKNHSLQALEDNTVVYAVHAIRDKKTSDILDPSMVPKIVYDYGILNEVTI